MLKVPTRLTITVWVYSASGCGPSLPTVREAGAMPAQFTRPTSLPSDVAFETTA